MEQLWLNIGCAADALGLSTNRSEDKIEVKSIGNASSVDAFIIHFQKFYSFKDIPEHKSYGIITFDGLFKDVEAFDDVFLNLGHHALRADGEVKWTFSQMAHEI